MIRQGAMMLSVSVKLSLPCIEINSFKQSAVFQAVAWHCMTTNYAACIWLQLSQFKHRKLNCPEIFPPTISSLVEGSCVFQQRAAPYGSKVLWAALRVS